MTAPSTHAPLGVISADEVVDGAFTTTDSSNRPRRRAPSSTTLRHRNCLDGVRGIAVLTVVGFHMDIGWMSGGYLGVDVFFVLSGFLITTLLLREWRRSDRIDLASFWARRGRRLLPAMLLVLAGVALFAVFFAEPEQLDDIRNQGIASLFYVTNWVRALEKTSYFDNFAAKSPLEHYWSLAIEEQFYLVWPLIALGVFRLRSRIERSLPDGRRYAMPFWVIGIVGALASAIWMFVLYRPDATGLYFRTDTRVQGLFIGVAIAGLFDGLGDRLGHVRSRTWQWAGWTAGALFLGACVINPAPGVLYRGGFLAVAVLTAVVIIAAMATPGSGLDRTLSRRPLRFFGRISYGLYLWHWPVILVLSQQRTGLPLVALNVVRLVVSVLLAIASLLLIEIPFRERRLPVRFEFAGLAVGPILVAAALIGSTAGGRQTLQEAYDAEHAAGVAAPSRAPTIEMPDELTTVVVGDSLAGLLPADWGDPDGDGPATLTTTRVGTGCPETDPECSTWDENWRREVRAAEPDVVTVAIDDWHRFDRTGVELDVFNPSKTQQAFADGMTELATKLGAGPIEEGGRTVVFVTAPVDRTNDSIQTFSRERTRDAAAQTAAESNGAISAVTLDSLWCGDVRCIDPTHLGEGVLGATDLTAFGVALADAVRSSVRRHLEDEATGDRLDVLLLGDSVAWSIGSNFYGVGQEPEPDDPVVLTNKAEFACAPDTAEGWLIGDIGRSTTECPDWAERWPEIVRASAPDIVLVPGSQWMILDREVDGQRIAFDSPEGHARVRDIYLDLVDRLAATGPLVVLATVIPNVGSVRGYDPDLLVDSQRRELELNSILREVVAARSDTAALIDLAGWICDGPDCQEYIDNVRLRPDGGHFAPEAAHFAGEFLIEQLQDVAQDRGLIGAADDGTSESASSG